MHPIAAVLPIAVSPGQDDSKIFGVDPLVLALAIVGVSVVVAVIVAVVVLRSVRRRATEMVARRAAMGMPGYGPPPPQYRAPTQTPAPPDTVTPPNYAPPPDYGQPPPPSGQ